jgi:hypothetical protein
MDAAMTRSALALALIPDWIVRRTSLDPATGCLRWEGAAYRGRPVGHRPEDGKVVRIHRETFQAVHGSLAKSTVLKPACAEARCCHPDHFTATPRGVVLLQGDGCCAVNARKTCCVRGHPLAGDNLYVDTRGCRRCRACRSINTKDFRRHRKATVSGEVADGRRLQR